MQVGYIKVLVFVYSYVYLVATYLYGFITNITKILINIVPLNYFKYDRFKSQFPLTKWLDFIRVHMLQVDDLVSK